jgi:homoserine dehydrogenase
MSDTASTSPILVLKLGGSVLRTAADLPRAVSEVYRHWREGARVVAVVSAFGPTTDELLQRAEQLGLPPGSSAFPAYLGSGELTAASLLTLSLHRAGLPATLLDPAGAGLRAAGDPGDAELVGLDRQRLLGVLDQGIAVLPGFVGRFGDGSAALLGRGGSDLTALFVAAELGAGCVLLKDVGALFTADPVHQPGDARRFATITWSTARATAGGAVQDKALRFAAGRGLAFTVRAPGADDGTFVGPGPDRLGPPLARRPVLRVAVFGHGVVGGGVVAHLRERQDLFELVGVGVRAPRRERPGLPLGLATTGEGLVDRPADVLVEVGGGADAADAVGAALARGRHVVTANKALLAERGQALARLARRRGVRLLASAAVGGALPALETVARLAASGRRIVGLRAVLNGTSGVVLDGLARGEALAEVVAEARRRGFAEADSSLDLDGTDAAQKLALLLRAAGCAVPSWRAFGRRGVADAAAMVARLGGTWRLVAAATLLGDRLAAASLEPRRLPPGDFLASGPAAAATLEVTLRDGAVVRAQAQGAGRWPTAEAVLADLDDLRREGNALDPESAAGGRSSRLRRPFGRKTARPLPVGAGTPSEVAP